MALPNLDRWLVELHPLRRRLSLHEMGHRWGALARSSVPGVNLGLGHWKTPFPTIGLDYFEIDSVMGGVPGSRTMFAWLDLYLMGLVPPSMVPPYDYVRADGERIPVPIESIIEATGPRVPAYPYAPSHFRVAFVVLTPTGYLPRACELELAQEWSEEFPAWWHEGTRGWSTVEVGLR
jgi:hypothetical protein